MTPYQIFLQLKRQAKAENVTIEQYCLARKVSPGTASKLKNGTVNISVRTLEKLEIKI